MARLARCLHRRRGLQRGQREEAATAAAVGRQRLGAACLQRLQPADRPSGTSRRAPTWSTMAAGVRGSWLAATSAAAVAAGAAPLGAAAAAQRRRAAALGDRTGAAAGCCTCRWDAARGRPNAACAAGSARAAAGLRGPFVEAVRIIRPLVTIAAERQCINTKFRRAASTSQRT